MIVCMAGDLGKGKTLTMTALGWALHSKGEHIVSNYDTEYSDAVVSSPHELDDHTKNNSGTQLMDELWAWADSRDTQRNDTINEMALNSRKRGDWTILYTVQSFIMIDARLRDITNYILLPKHEEGVVHDRVTVTVVKRTTMQKVGSFRYKPDMFYGMYDTTEEVAGERAADTYDDIIEAEVVRVNSEEYQYPGQLRSRLRVEENMSGQVVDDIANVVIMRSDAHIGAAGRLEVE